MWNTDISRQSVVVEGHRFTAADRAALLRLGTAAPQEELRAVYAFLSEWFSDRPYMEVQTSGSTGVPKRMRAGKKQMMHSACRTCEFLGLKKDDTALLCMNLKYIGAMMMVVRALVAEMRLIVRRASSCPLADVNERVDFLSVVPMQLYHCVQDADARKRLSQIRCVIVGGGAVDNSLCRQLQNLPCAVFSTYGMTETLSHIALRRLNGSEASERYTPLKGIDLSLSDQSTLIIRAPEICRDKIKTNDIARLYEDGTFTLSGRTDNVVNSGGIKIQIEEDEQLLRQHLPAPFALTSIPHERLGEALVLLVQTDCTLTDSELQLLLKRSLPRYHAPRSIVRLPRIPETGNGKTDRKACRELATKFCKDWR